jgi:D-beta-D-heptose 7-phosphate kinase/D-beta-D-heptose 1-phosphate adenosyltransferase
MSASAKTKTSRALLKSLTGVPVLVLGDLMLDEFIWGNVVRISPEAPVPVVEITRQSFHVGGAGNVAANARTLGGDPVLVGVIGEDGPGERVRAELDRSGVRTELILARGGRPTTVKTRIVAHNQQIVRADREQSDDLPASLEEEVLDRVATALPGCRALVVSDYHKGVVTARVMRAALGLAKRRRIPVLVDPKVPHFSLYKGVSLVTPNTYEAEQATGIAIRSTADLERAGREILKRLSCGAALVTRGEHGMSLFLKGKPPVHIPTSARQVFDVTGAGDTVIATLGLALGAGATLVQAARLANRAAGIVVGKLGTATVTPEEIEGAPT